MLTTTATQRDRHLHCRGIGSDHRSWPTTTVAGSSCLSSHADMRSPPVDNAWRVVAHVSIGAVAGASVGTVRRSLLRSLPNRARSAAAGAAGTPLFCAACWAMHGYVAAPGDSYVDEREPQGSAPGAVWWLIQREESRDHCVGQEGAVALEWPAADDDEQLVELRGAVGPQDLAGLFDGDVVP
jgi:hypothetical protein